MTEIATADGDAISMVIPTRNRAHTLRQVAESYFQQEGVDEIVVIDDAGDDETGALLTEIASRYPRVKLELLRNLHRVGASGSRNRGAAVVKNKLVLFCDDDEFLERGYAILCRRKLEEIGVSAISGRRIYMRDGESSTQALARFGDGLRSVPPYRRLLCEHIGGAKFKGDLEMPFTTAVILTWTALVRQYGFDEHYARGNGYREETDYQMNLFVNGHTIIQTSETHSIHLSASATRRGGQRVSRWYRVYWAVVYTRYFYSKYWERYAKRVGIRSPQWFALSCFAVFAIYREYVRPLLAPLVFASMRFRATTK